MYRGSAKAARAKFRVLSVSKLQKEGLTFNYRCQIREGSGFGLGKIASWPLPNQYLFDVDASTTSIVLDVKVFLQALIHEGEVVGCGLEYEPPWMDAPF